MVSPVLSVTTGERLDSVISAINGESAFIWFVLVGTFLGFVIQQLMSYTKNNHRDKEDVYATLDEKTFQSAALPLLFQLDSQVAEIISVTFGDQATSEEIVSQYEDERKKAIQDLDVSSLLEASALSNALRVSAKANYHRSEYAKTYRQVRQYLKLLVWTLGANLLVAVGVFIAVNGFEDKLYDRYAFVLWVILMLANVAIGLLYFNKRVRLDTMKEFDL
jgi:putative exporter of polyketide antibiotics